MKCTNSNAPAVCGPIFIVLLEPPNSPAVQCRIRACCAWFGTSLRWNGALPQQQAAHIPTNAAWGQKSVCFPHSRLKISYQDIMLSSVITKWNRTNKHEHCSYRVVFFILTVHFKSIATFCQSTTEWLVMMFFSPSKWPWLLTELRAIGISPSSVMI